MLSLVEEFKLGKARFFQMLHDSRDILVKNTQPSVIIGCKWKAKNCCRKCRIRPVANGRAGLSLHPQHWWSKESTINKRKMVLEEIHHLEKVSRVAWTKWESCHMEQPQAHGT